MFRNFAEWNGQRLKQYQKKNYRLFIILDDNGDTSLISENQDILSGKVEQ